MEFFFVLGGVAIVALIVVGIVFSIKASAKRREELAAFAQRHGLQSHVAQGSGCLNAGIGGGDWPGVQLLPIFQEFQPFGTGEQPRAHNVILGDVGDRTFYFFDYQYTTTSTTTDSEGNTSTSTTTHSFGVAAVRFPMAFQVMEIRHEGMFDRIGGALGFKDVQFEMEEFNRKFHVTCRDQKFAYDVIHPGVMEFLLAHPSHHWQFNGCYLLVYKMGQYSAAEYEEVMQDMQGFLDLVPDYVRQDIGFQPTWNSPFG
jgi:hypothetical protein